MSAYPLTAVDRFDNLRALAKKISATDLSNARTQDGNAEIEKVIGVQGVDACIDDTVQSAITEIGYAITNSQGWVNKRLPFGDSISILRLRTYSQVSPVGVA